MSMEALAREAGVARSTVSKAFSGSKEISEETRARIFEIAKKHGVYDKYIRRTGEKRVIAVIAPEYQSGLYSQQLYRMNQEITARGAVMVSACDSFDMDTRLELLNYFAECMKVNGIISIPPIKLKRKYATPIVCVAENDLCDSICLTSDRAFSEAIRYLKENGHTEIALITEKLTHSWINRYLQTMREYNLPIRQEYIVETPLRFEEGGYSAMHCLLQLEKRPTAVFVAYDSMALGAMKCIYDHGFSVPEDFSVIGKDDNVINPYLNVPLSSITTYNEDLCQIAVETLFERIEVGEAVPPRKIRVSGTFIPRASVGPAKR